MYVRNYILLKKTQTQKPYGIITPRKSRTPRICSRKPRRGDRHPDLSLRQHPTLDREAAVPCRGMRARTAGAPGEAGLATGQTLGSVSPPGAGADPALGLRSCQRMPQKPRPPHRPCRRRHPGAASPASGVPRLPSRSRTALPALPPAGTRLPRSRSPRAARLLPTGPRTVSRRDGLDLHPHGSTASPQPRSPARPDPQCGQCPWAAAGRGRPWCPSAPAANAGQGRGGDGEGTGGSARPRSERPGAAGTRRTWRRGCPCAGIAPHPTAVQGMLLPLLLPLPFSGQGSL